MHITELDVKNGADQGGENDTAQAMTYDAVLKTYVYGSLRDRQGKEAGSAGEGGGEESGVRSYSCTYVVCGILCVRVVGVWVRFSALYPSLFTGDQKHTPH